MNIFKRSFYNLLDETNLASAGGVFGDLGGDQGHGGDVPGGSDWYAPGDARNIMNSGEADNKKKKKKKKTIPMQRRSLNKDM